MLAKAVIEIAAAASPRVIFLAMPDLVVFVISSIPYDCLLFQAFLAILILLAFTSSDVLI